MPRRRSYENPDPTPISILDFDRSAVRRAQVSLEAVRSVLPETAVSDLAREVISRLAAKAAPNVAQPDMQTRLCDALLSREDDAAMEVVRELLSQGVEIDTIYLGHLAGAARHLGQMWTEDQVHSTGVTIAAGRIYRIMRGLSSRLVPEKWPDGSSAIFASAPGERHTLGVSMAADLFRRDGWLVELKIGRSHDELMQELAETNSAILGLSAAGSNGLESVIRVVAAVRVSNPHMQILLAGNIVEQQPDLLRLTGADAAAANFDEARVGLRAMLDRLTSASVPLD